MKFRNKMNNKASGVLFTALFALVFFSGCEKETIAPDLMSKSDTTSAIEVVVKRTDLDSVTSAKPDSLKLDSAIADSIAKPLESKVSISNPEEKPASSGSADPEVKTADPVKNFSNPLEKSPEVEVKSTDPVVTPVIPVTPVAPVVVPANPVENFSNPIDKPSDTQVTTTVPVVTPVVIPPASIVTPVVRDLTPTVPVVTPTAPVVTPSAPVVTPTAPVVPPVVQTAVIPGYNIQNALPANYVKNGTVDYTKYVQDAINKNAEIVFPGFPILINDAGLIIKSEKTISFMKGGELWLAPSSKESYAVINIKNLSKVVINDAVIRGDRYKHNGTTGEWGHGISINSSSNVTLNNPKVYDCWGDGIYVGGSTISSKNIVINNAYCRSNRRNGISVTNVDGLTLKSPYIGFTDGTLPMSGIDIEPNTPNDEIKNIRITDPVSEQNKEYGIQLSLSKLYGKTDKLLNVTIERHRDTQSNSAFKISCYNKYAVNGEKVSGTVSVINPVWTKNVKNPDLYGLQEPNLKLTIQNPTIYNVTGSILNATSLTQLFNRVISKTTTLDLQM